MLRKILITILIIPLLNNCGFEVIDRSNIAQFDINQITSSGDRRINYRIKEKLKFAKSENDKRLININLNTEKNKSVKERNIKHEITKYQIEIKINVKLSDIYDKNISNFIVTKSVIIMWKINILIHSTTKKNSSNYYQRTLRTIFKTK